MELHQTGDIKSWDCFQTQSNQCYKEFCAELPKEEKQFRMQLNTDVHERENTLGVITKDAYQSLHDVFIELFGEDHLFVADISLNNAVLQLESFDNMTQHGIPMLKWLLTLYFLPLRMNSSTPKISKM